MLSSVRTKDERQKARSVENFRDLRRIVCVKSAEYKPAPVWDCAHFGQESHMFHVEQFELWMTLKSVPRGTY